MSQIGKWVRADGQQRRKARKSQFHQTSESRTCPITGRTIWRARLIDKNKYQPVRIDGKHAGFMTVEQRKAHRL